MLDGAAPDPRQDQYALGVLLYELVTGKLPIGDFAPLPGPLDAVVRKLLAPDPGRRYSSAAEVAEVLRALAPHAAPADEEHLWMQGVAAVLTVCTAIALWALLLCLTPRVIAPGDQLPLVMIDDAARLPDGRLVSWARFEIGPLLAAFAAVGVSALAYQILELRWRRAGPAPAGPVRESALVFKLGVFCVALYGVRRAFEAIGYIGIFRYMPIVGGLLEIGVVWFTWYAILETRRRKRPLTGELALWAGVALALVPPVTDFVRWLARWRP